MVNVIDDVFWIYPVGGLQMVRSMKIFHSSCCPCDDVLSSWYSTPSLLLSSTTRGPPLRVTQVITPCQLAQARLQWNV